MQSNKKKKTNLKIIFGLGNSLLVQWIGLHASTAKGASLVPGWGTKILNATGPKKRKKDHVWTKIDWNGTTSNRKW